MIKCLKALIRDLRHMWQPNGAGTQKRNLSNCPTHKQRSERKRKGRRRDVVSLCSSHTKCDEMIFSSIGKPKQIHKLGGETVHLRQSLLPLEQS